jgi:hypothetical protein
MNQTTPPDDHLRTGPDALDRLLSDFFKAQMPRPWPAAPAAVVSEPAAAVSATAPYRPAAGRDSGTKSRYTLAASAVLLLGTCWALSNGFQPVDRPGPGITTGPKVPGVVGGATASDPPALRELRNDKQKAGNGDVFLPPPIKFGP